MSLYRKYRPQSMADVVGQDHIVTTLEHAAEQGKLAHAYLFAGSRGTGKTSVARILAKIIMIQGIEDEKIQKQILKGVEEGSIVDLMEIDAASNRGIDEIRDLIAKIQFSPVAASAKVYIIDEVHMLTKEAFNALLKTLEEPPPYAYFILATTEIHKVPETIQSRCQRFPFHRIREEDIVRRLQYIADQERIGVEREALRAIAHHVEGGLRDAIALLDQMRSLEKITVDDIEQRTGASGREYVATVVEAIQGKDTGKLIETVRKLEEAGIPLDTFVQQLLRMVREALHETIEKGKSPDAIVRMLDTLLAAVRDIRISPLPGLVLESALVSLCTEGTKGTDADLSAVKEKAESQQARKEKVKSEKRKVKEEEEKVIENRSTEERAEKEVREATVEAPEISLQSIQENWEGILSGIESAPVKMSLKDSHIVAVTEKKVTVSFSSAFHRDKVANTEASRAVEGVMEKIFKRSLKLDCVLESSGGTENKHAEESVNLAEAAAEIF